MPNYTPNLNLEKPLPTEIYNIDVHNTNSDKIDEASQAHRAAPVIDHPDGSVTEKKLAGLSVSTRTLQSSGVTPGTYRSVTVDRTGRVMQGSNPSRLGDYGITDAYTKTESDNRFVNVTKTFVGATTSKNGESGLVPAPAQGTEKMFLSAQGGWSALPDIPTNVSSFYNDAKYITVEEVPKNISGLVDDKHQLGIIAGILAQNGWAKFANGLLLQWGKKNSNPQSFPITFNTVYTVYHIATSSDWSRINELTTTGFKSSTNNGYFFAIGM